MPNHLNNRDMKLLLISNSASPGESYLEKPGQDIARHLGNAKGEVVFIPFAGVIPTFDEYVEKVNKALAPHGVKVRGIHTFGEPLRAIAEAKAIMIGGGNTFRLLRMMQEGGILHTIRERVRAGVPYVGWSAGANVACPTICTTNDMPIVQPLSFEALNLVPFQINPHYLDVHPDNHGGETREQRIMEYIAANPGKYVIGLREGSRLLLEGDKLTMLGEKKARIFLQGKAPREIKPTADVNFLMTAPKSRK